MDLSGLAKQSQIFKRWFKKNSYRNYVIMKILFLIMSATRAAITANNPPIASIPPPCKKKDRKAIKWAITYISTRENAAHQRAQSRRRCTRREGGEQSQSRRRCGHFAAHERAAIRFRAPALSTLYPLGAAGGARRRRKSRLRPSPSALRRVLGLGSTRQIASLRCPDWFSCVASRKRIDELPANWTLR